MTAIRSIEYDLDDSSVEVELGDSTTRRDVLPELPLAQVSSIRHFRLDFAGRTFNAPPVVLSSWTSRRVAPPSLVA
jgi:hypothetical protein